jgi:outer membrane protein
MKTTFRLAAVAGLLAATAFSAPAMAQTFTASDTGYQAGNILVHLSGLDVIPENFTSHVMEGTKDIGTVRATQQFAPELDASYFLTPYLSLELIAATTRHDISVATKGGHVDVGDTWVLPPTLTAQYHLPMIGVVRPYVGAGVTLAFYYDSHVAGNTFAHEAFRTSVGPTLDAGFDVPVSGNWVVNVDVKQMFLNTSASVDHGVAKAQTSLSPTVVGVGVGYIF